LRPQYTRAICGACGKKQAYVSTGSLSSGNVYHVRCTGCKAHLHFHQYGIQGLEVPVWPGSLEAAAAMLKGGSMLDNAGKDQPSGDRQFTASFEVIVPIETKQPLAMVSAGMVVEVEPSITVQAATVKIDGVEYRGIPAYETVDAFAIAMHMAGTLNQGVAQATLGELLEYDQVLLLTPISQTELSVEVITKESLIGVLN
jgi:hypothetical protein